MVSEDGGGGGAKAAMPSSLALIIGGGDDKDLEASLWGSMECSTSLARSERCGDNGACEVSAKATSGG